MMDFKKCIAVLENPMRFSMQDRCDAVELATDALRFLDQEAHTLLECITLANIYLMEQDETFETSVYAKNGSGNELIMESKEV